MSLVSDIKQLFFSLRCFVHYGYQKTVVDRGMLFADFVLASLLPYFMQFFIWTFIYKQSHLPVQILSFDTLMFYYAFAIAMGRLNNPYNTVESVSYALAEGSFVTSLLKPLAFPLQKFGEFLGESLLYWFPILGLVLLRSYYAEEEHVKISQCALLFLMFFLSQLLCFLFGFLLSLVAFWVRRSEFTLALLSTSAGFFGGTLLPPSLWPKWLTPVMLYNPFRFMIAGPAEVLSSFDFSQIGTILAGLSIYCLLFIHIAGIVWDLALKKYEVWGG